MARNHAARAAYAGEVRTLIVETFDVSASDWVDRLIAEAPAPAECVGFIGDYIGLNPLPSAPP